MSEGLQNFTSVVTSLAAFGGVCLAWFGLFTWKKQLEFSTDSDLAKKILVLVYRHFDALLAVRVSAAISGGLDTADGSREIAVEEARRRFTHKSIGYKTRFAKVSEVRAEVYPLLIEGQAYWGREFRSLFDGLWKLERELQLIVNLYLELENPDRSPEHKQAHFPILSEKRDILHDRDAETDILATDYSAELVRIEDFLRTKLGRKVK